MLLHTLRRLRHGPLKAFGPAWVSMGSLYRKAVRGIPGLSVRQKIGSYGPFRMAPELAFTDLENWGGAHNRGFSACIEACRSRLCVFDVGAHIGLVTLPAASVLAEGGQLFAFEPAQANAVLLQRHLHMNGLADRVEVVRSLAGERDEEAVGFYESVGPHGQNAIVLKGERTLVSEHGGYTHLARPQRSLDSFCAERKLRPEVIKIDVEGAEIGVLRGAEEVLTRYRPVIFLSVHPKEIALAGHDLDELTSLVDTLGYRLLNIEGKTVTAYGLDEYVMTPREALPR